MEIRPLKTEEIDTVVDIWYRGSLIAHDFIDKAYWESMKTEMKKRYLPMSKTYAMEQDSKIVGFVSMVEHYLAALFIDDAQYKKGYGSSLIQFIKEQHDVVELKVYQRNARALKFYLKNDFVIVEESIDEAASEKEYVMIWKKANQA